MIRWPVFSRTAVLEIGAELYDVTTDAFKNHMNALVSRGIKGSLYDSELADSSKDVVITFDDGEMNNFSDCDFLYRFSYLCSEIKNGGIIGCNKKTFV